MSRIFTWLVVGTLILYSATGLAGGEHQRRFAVELAVVAGDSRLLMTDELSGDKRKWIEMRITGALNILPLLVRYSIQEAGRSDPALVTRIQNLQTLATDVSRLHQELLILSRQYPVSFSLHIPQVLTPLTISSVAGLYNSLCYSCHIAPAMEKSVVVGELGSFARAMSESEWLARMIGGLHGDAYTGLENPFTDEQIALLLSYIKIQVP